MGQPGWPVLGSADRQQHKERPMFILKKALPRRTVLQGMGAALALPFLDAMVPALTAAARTAANPPRRFGAVFVPLGERPGFWTPATVGSNFEFTPVLKPLEKF